MKRKPRPTLTAAKRQTMSTTTTRAPFRCSTPRLTTAPRKSCGRSWRLPVKMARAQGRLAAVREGLGEDRLAEVVAFCWVGQGTYDVADWDEAMEEATALSSSGSDAAIDELLDMPMLASVMEAGLAAFDLSC